METYPKFSSSRDYGTVSMKSESRPRAFRREGMRKVTGARVRENFLPKTRRRNEADASLHQMQKPVCCSHSGRGKVLHLLHRVSLKARLRSFSSRPCPRDALDTSRNDTVFSSAAFCGYTAFFPQLENARFTLSPVLFRLHEFFIAFPSE